MSDRRQTTSRSVLVFPAIGRRLYVDDRVLDTTGLVPLDAAGRPVFNPGKPK